MTPVVHYSIQPGEMDEPLRFECHWPGCGAVVHSYALDVHALLHGGFDVTVDSRIRWTSSPLPPKEVS